MCIFYTLQAATKQDIIFAVRGTPADNTLSHPIPHDNEAFATIQITGGLDPKSIEKKITQLFLDVAFENPEKTVLVRVRNNFLTGWIIS